MADYIEAIYNHHFKSETSLAEKTKVVGQMQREHETELLEPLLEYLGNKKDTKILGSSIAKERLPTVAIDLGKSAEVAAKSLAAHKIMASGGDFYATRLLKALDVKSTHGVLRFSFVHYTSKADIDRLVIALDSIF